MYEDYMTFDNVDRDYYIKCGNCGELFNSIDADDFDIFTNSGYDDVEDPGEMEGTADFYATCPYCGEKTGSYCFMRPREFIPHPILPPSEGRLLAAKARRTERLGQTGQSYGELSSKYGLPAPEDQGSSLMDKYGLKSFGKRKRRHTKRDANKMKFSVVGWKKLFLPARFAETKRIM
jgi:DNA-directed RNA polymerase subunit RPC12/RpoP